MAFKTYGGTCAQRELLSKAIPEFGSGDWQLLSCQITGLHKQLRKSIVFSRVSYRPCAEKRAQSAHLVAKVYPSDRGGRALAALRQLWQAGFRPPFAYRVPRPYGYSPAEATLLQGSAPGTEWSRFLAGDERALAAASERAAVWLIRLQRSRVIAEVVGSERDVAAVCRYEQEIAASFPQLASWLQTVGERLEDALRAGDCALVLSHGDYHPNNVFLTSRVTTVIDFDTFGLREPAFDVGYAIGQLLIMSYLKMGSFAPGARAALAFWRRYARQGEAEWPRVALHVARTFLQSLHYELCVLHTKRLELLDLWPTMMKEWFSSNDARLLAESIRGWPAA